VLYTIATHGGDYIDIFGSRDLSVSQIDFLSDGDTEERVYGESVRECTLTEEIRLQIYGSFKYMELEIYHFVP